MKKKKFISLILIFLISIMSFTSSVDAEMTEGLIPQDEEDKVGNVKIDAAEYPLLNYGMDTDPDESIWDFAKLSDNTNEALMTLNSFLWNMNKIFYNFVSWLVTEAFSMDIIGTFSEGMGKVIQTIAGVSSSGFADQGLWPIFLPLLIIGLGVWVIYRGIMQRQTSVAVSGIISAIAICTLSLGFYANAQKVLTNTNDFMKEAQNDILSLSLSKSSNVSYTDNEGLAAMKNQLFAIMVKYPWMLMEFGTMDEDKLEKEWRDKGNKGSRIDTLLSTKPFSEERSEAVNYEVKDLKNENMSVDSLTSRLGVIFIVLILNIFLGVILTLISGSLIFFSFTAMSALALTPMTFLAGMIPSLQQTAINGLMKIIYAFYMKLGLTLLAVIFFVISSFIYAKTDPTQGLVMTFIFQIVLSLSLWMNREKLLRIASKPFNAVAQPGNTPGLQISDYKKGYYKIKQKAQPVINKFSLPNNGKPMASTNKEVQTPTITKPNQMPVKNVTPAASMKQTTVTPSQQTASTQPKGAETRKPLAGTTAQPIQEKQIQPKPLNNVQSSNNVQPTNNVVSSINRPDQTKVNNPAPVIPRTETESKQPKNINTNPDSNYPVRQPMKRKEIKPVKLKINDWREED